MPNSAALSRSSGSRRPDSPVPVRRLPRAADWSAEVSSVVSLTKGPSLERAPVPGGARFGDRSCPDPAGGVQFGTATTAGAGFQIPDRGSTVSGGALECARKGGRLDRRRQGAIGSGKSTMGLRRRSSGGEHLPWPRGRSPNGLRADVDNGCSYEINTLEPLWHSPPSTRSWRVGVVRWRIGHRAPGCDGQNRDVPALGRVIGGLSGPVRTDGEYQHGRTGA